MLKNNNKKPTRFSNFFWIYFVIILIFYTLEGRLLFSQVNPALKSQGELVFFVDYSIFKTQPGQAKLEIYYQFQLNSLKFIPRNDTLSAIYSIQILIKDTTDQKSVSQNLILSTQANSLQEITGENKIIVDIIKQFLVPGSYTGVLKIQDVNSKKEGSCFFPIHIPDYEQSSLSMSSIQLASIIKNDSSANKFVKNNKRIIPNPERRYIYGHSKLYLYFEIYHLKPHAIDSLNTFSIQYAMQLQNGKNIIEYQPILVRKSGDSALKVQAIDLSQFVAGQYKIQVRVRDNFSKEEVTQVKDFFINVPIEATPDLPMSKTDIEQYYDQIKYIATPSELDLFKKLDIDGKKNFLISFWRSKDQTPETPENEFMMEYFKRIDYANKHFQWHGNGMNSDMGRIFILYGMPTDEEKHYWEEGTTDYIIWHYSNQSTPQKFIFVDRNREGIYYLVHSTVIGEVKNEDWMNYELK